MTNFVAYRDWLTGEVTLFEPATVDYITATGNDDDSGEDLTRVCFRDVDGVLGSGGSTIVVGHVSDIIATINAHLER